MLKSYFQIPPVYRFLIQLTILSIAWYFIYYYFLQPKTSLDEWVIDLTLSFSKSILNLLGHSSFVEGRIIRIAGTSGLWVGDNCNAIALFALFSGVIISFPGNIKSKLWFIPLGIFIVFVINALRMVLLAIIDTYSREWTEFNHTYTFTIIIYGVIFILWMKWINSFSFAKKNDNRENQ